MYTDEGWEKEERRQRDGDCVSKERRQKLSIKVFGVKHSREMAEDRRS